MKTNKTLLSIIVATAIFGLFSFKMAYEAKKSSAEVEQYQGVYIYTDAKPVLETEYLGTVKTSYWNLSGTTYPDLKEKLIKKTKADFPTAEGIILSFKSNGTSQCDAIKFK